MEKIRVFICVANEDIARARELRRILADCYGFYVFLYDHALVPSDDFVEEILHNVTSCDIFVPLLSDRLKKSGFCNQEIGVAVGKGIKIFPISIDKTEPYALIDHIHRLRCDVEDSFGVLKAATEFFQIVLSHRNFRHMSDSATQGLIEALKVSPNAVTTSGIVYMLDLTKGKIALSHAQLDDICWAAKNNSAVRDSGLHYRRLYDFLRIRYSISLDGK